MVKTVDAGAGINWLQGGWAAFKSGGPLLIGMVFVSLLMVIVVRLVPWLGALLAPILVTFLYSGMLISVRGSAGGRLMQFDDLWSAFGNQDKMVHLAIVALVPTLGELLRATLPGGFFGWLISGLIGVTVLALTYFAVPLVLFRDQEAPVALKSSFDGVLANLPAVIVFWIACIILTVIAIIPVGLGLLVMIPVLLGAAYEAYAEIYGDTELVPNGPAATGAPPPPPAP